MSLYLAILLTVALITAIHYFPFMTLAREGMPAVMIYLLNLMAMLVPLTLLFLDWGIHPSPWQMHNNVPAVNVWVLALWGFGILDLGTIFVLCLLDDRLAERNRAEMAEAETKILKEELE